MDPTPTPPTFYQMMDSVNQFGLYHELLRSWKGAYPNLPAYEVQRLVSAFYKKYKKGKDTSKFAICKKISELDRTWSPTVEADAIRMTLPAGQRTLSQMWNKSSQNGGIKKNGDIRNFFGNKSPQNDSNSNAAGQSTSLNNRKRRLEQIQILNESETPPLAVPSQLKKVKEDGDDRGTGKNPIQIDDDDEDETNEDRPEPETMIEILEVFSLCVQDPIAERDGHVKEEGEGPCESSSQMQMNDEIEATELKVAIRMEDEDEMMDTDTKSGFESSDECTRCSQDDTILVPVCKQEANPVKDEPEQCEERNCIDFNPEDCPIWVKDIKSLMEED